MAKSLRSKAKRRLRTVRREHHWDTRGKFELQAIAARLHNPQYDLRSDFQRKVNAFVEPNNPDAHFPQIAKPDIHDFRSHKMINGGLAAIGVFRKHRSANAIQSKYPTIVRTAEEIEAEENEAKNAMAIDSSEEEEEVKAPAKNYTIDDIMTLDKSLQINKKKKQADASAVPAVVQKKSKNIKKVKHAKKSQKIVKF